MSYLIKIDKKTGGLENKGICYDAIPQYLDCYDFRDEKFSFRVPAGFSLQQIFWNKENSSFDELFVLLQAKSDGYDHHRSNRLYSGSGKLLEKREIVRFDKDTLEHVKTGVDVNLIYKEYSGREYAIRKIRTKSDEGELSDKIILIHEKSEIPLEELYSKNKKNSL